ncbi:MAG TPA: hypothetical protein VF524_06065 [Polyangia bacterium]
MAFLKENVTVDSLSAVLERAVAQLTNLPDFSVARNIGVAFAARTDVVRRRCEELFRFLGEKQDSPTDFQWSR